jgi:hypothetical protein
VAAGQGVCAHGADGCRFFAGEVSAAPGAADAKAWGDAALLRLGASCGPGAQLTGRRQGCSALTGARALPAADEAACWSACEAAARAAPDPQGFACEFTGSQCFFGSHAQLSPLQSRAAEAGALQTWGVGLTAELNAGACVQQASRESLAGFCGDMLAAPPVAQPDLLAEQLRAVPYCPPLAQGTEAFGSVAGSRAGNCSDDNPTACSDGAAPWDLQCVRSSLAGESYWSCAYPDSLPFLCTKDSDCNPPWCPLNAQSWECFEQGQCRMSQAHSYELKKARCLSPPKDDPAAVPGTWSTATNSCQCPPSSEPVDGLLTASVLNPAPRWLLEPGGAPGSGVALSGDYDDPDNCLEAASGVASGALTCLAGWPSAGFAYCQQVKGIFAAGARTGEGNVAAKVCPMQTQDGSCFFQPAANCNGDNAPVDLCRPPSGPSFTQYRYYAKDGACAPCLGDACPPAALPSRANCLRDNAEARGSCSYTLHNSCQPEDLPSKITVCSSGATQETFKDNCVAHANVSALRPRPKRIECDPYLPDHGPINHGCDGMQFQNDDARLMPAGETTFSGSEHAYPCLCQWSDDKLLPDGSACNVFDECFSGLCPDLTCESSAVGAPCDDHHNCASLYCSPDQSPEGFAGSCREPPPSYFQP